jgi:hypothetical protein
MNAILTINNTTLLLLPLTEAVKVAEVLKTSTHLERTYIATKYTTAEKPVLVELELATETEANQWLS